MCRQVDDQDVQWPQVRREQGVFPAVNMHPGALPLRLHDPAIASTSTLFLIRPSSRSISSTRCTPWYSPPSRASCSASTISRACCACCARGGMRATPVPPFPQRAPPAPPRCICGALWQECSIYHQWVRPRLQHSAHAPPQDCGGASAVAEVCCKGRTWTSMCNAC